MGKFQLKWYNNQSYVPEDNGWTWSSETISPPSPRYKFLNLGGVSGSVDMSKAAAGSLLYDDRTITVTFARFKHGQDGWLDNITSMESSINTAFTSGYDVRIYPKTESNVYYVAKSYTRQVARDRIIQFVTLTFRVKPFSTATT